MRNRTSVWKACTLAGLANLRKTKRECALITRVLTHITKKWDKHNNTKQSLLKPILRCSSQAQRIEIFKFQIKILWLSILVFFPWTNILDLVGSVTHVMFEPEENSRS